MAYLPGKAMVKMLVGFEWRGISDSSIVDNHSNDKETKAFE